MSSPRPLPPRWTGSFRAHDLSSSSPTARKEGDDKLTARLFRGERARDGRGRVHLDGEVLAPESQLWETSLCLRNYSPSGPEWGSHGTGSAQLAITMLMAVTDTDEAERYSSTSPLRTPAREKAPSKEGSIR